MKNRLFKITTILFIGLSIVACKKAKNETEAKDAEEVSQIQSEAIRYIADIDSSAVAWKGFKPTESHNGTIKISEGYLAFDNDKLSGGNFIIDMKTIKNLDIKDAEYNTKLINHLKNADFFDVENHAFTVFTITGVDEEVGMSMIKGNLTIKGIKKNIQFPAAITVNGGEVTFKSEPFTIDRTEWDIKYNSGKFFDNLKDKLINDEIEFVIKITAKKA
ncbi:MAG: YceI family protein [Flavobacteriaceae bacterium]|nr:YceI family protein [Flavobacteriaceae bacterium]